MDDGKGLPVLHTESPDDQIIEVPNLIDYPRGEFLAVVSSPCPVGRYATGGVGGQMFTSCSVCGHSSPSTAMQRHVGPMLTLVVAQAHQGAEGPPMVAFRRLYEAELSA